MSIVLLPEFGGKGDRISKDGLGDGVTRRWGVEETPEFRIFGKREFQLAGLME
jgi:hypothetical protein